MEHGYNTMTTTIKPTTPSSINHTSTYLFRSHGLIKVLVPEHFFSHFAIWWGKMDPDSRTITSSKVLIGYRCINHSDDSHNIFIKDTSVPLCQTPTRSLIVINWNLIDCPAIESASLLVTDFSQELSHALSVRIILFFDVLHGLHMFFFQLSTSAIVSRHTQ